MIFMVIYSFTSHVDKHLWRKKLKRKIIGSVESQISIKNLRNVNPSSCIPTATCRRSGKIDTKRKNEKTENEIEKKNV